MRTIIRLTAIILLSAFTGKIAAQQADPPFLKYMNHPWVDSVMKSLSNEEKISQLIWIAGLVVTSLKNMDSGE
jgi:hypothetical protein